MKQDLLQSFANARFDGPVQNDRHLRVSRDLRLASLKKLKSLAGRDTWQGAAQLADSVRKSMLDEDVEIKKISGTYGILPTHSTELLDT